MVDILTHALVGLFIALLMSKWLGFEGIKWPVIAGVAAALMPDIDALAFLFSEGGFYAYHRAAAHSFISVVILSLVAAIVFSKFTKTFWRYFPLALTAALSHLLFDFITPAPVTQVFFPFSSTGIALNISPPVDVYLLAILVAGIVVARIHSTRQMKVAAYVLLFSLLLVGARFGAGLYAESRIESITGNAYLTPKLFNPLVWIVIQENDDSYTLSEFSVATGLSHVKEMPKNHNALVEASKSSLLVRQFISYARFPVALTDGNEVRWFDLRTSQDGSSGFSATVMLDDSMNVIEERMGI